MQINVFYPFQSENKVSGKTEQNVNSFTQKKSFFDYAVEKSEISKYQTLPNYSYGKDAKETLQSAGNTQQQNSAKENMLRYIQDNLKTLQDLVTDEDYSAMSELGLAADKEDPTTLVTVYERIQIELAAYGDGTVDTSGISKDKIEKVVASPAMAEALKLTQDMTTISDEAKAYLLKNEQEPTLNNVYKAVHSSPATQISTMSEADFSELKGQLTELLQKAGMEVNEETLANAKWLVERDIPVHVQNLQNLSELNQVDFSMQTEELALNVTWAMLFGMKATDAFVTANWVMPQTAAEVYDIIQNAKDETIYDIVKNQAVLNVANLKKYAASISSDDNTQTRDYQNSEYLRAKNVIVEARLQLTTSSLLAMEKLGIHIDYEEISMMVSTSKQLESEYYQKVFSTSNEEAVGYDKQISSVMNIMGSMSQVPSAVMADIYQGKIEFNLNSVYTESQNYSKATMTYEAVGTQVRTDLGDSMQKAFESIDGILEEQGIEINESTRRAARILGYNQMEIHQEAVRQMESLMTELDYTKDYLTPKTAAMLVENNINILNIDIRELNKLLEELNGMIGADTNENFAQYLWKLEKNQKISKEQREKYIDLYRTLHMVEQADGKSLGALTSQGAEFTLANLMHAVKSAEKQVDVRVDNEFGELSEPIKEAIWSQSEENLSGFVKKMAQKVRINLNAENVEQVYKNGAFAEVSVGNLVDIVSENESLRTNEQLRGEYIRQMMERYMSEAQTKGVTEESVLTMLEAGVPASMENIISAISVSTPGSELRKYLLDKQNEQIKRAAEDILEQFEDEEQVQKSMIALKNTVKEELDIDKLSDISYETIKAVTDFNRNIQFMANSAKNQTYHIPVELNGEAVTIRVSMIAKEGAGQAEISINTMQYGMIKGVILAEQSEERIETTLTIYCEDSEVVNQLNAKKEDMISKLQNLGNTEKISVQVIEGSAKNQLEKNPLQTFGMKKEKVTNSYYYKASKSFIQSVKECLETNR